MTHDIVYSRMCQILDRLRDDPGREKDLYLAALREYLNDPQYEWQEGERQEFKNAFFLHMYSTQFPLNPFHKAKK